MTHLLGSKNCMDSLSQDVKDTQSAVEDIIAKVGSIHAQSWKFPDKAAAEIDVPELLDDYSHCKDAEYNRLAHIILFELVIDRLLFLIHGATRYLEIMFLNNNPDTEQSRITKGATSSVSIGPVVKKFWSKVFHFGLSLQKQKQEAADAVQHVNSLKADIDELKEDNSILRETIMSSKPSRKPSSNKVSASSSAHSSKSERSAHSKEQELISKFMSKSLNFVDSQPSQDIAVQTLETSFVPCEACARMQQNLLEVGATVISVCESLGLPSSLAKQKKMLRQSLMAAADVSRWATEQSRDLQRINKHLDNLYAQINPLQSQLNSTRERCKLFEKQVQDYSSRLTMEIQEKEEVKTALEQRTHDMNSQRVAMLAEKEEVCTQVERLRAESEKQCSELRADLEAQKKVRESLQSENEQLLKDLERVKIRLREEENNTANFEEQQRELTNLRATIEEAKKELDKTKAENSAISKHDKALQVKYDSLLKRVDELDEECDELQTTISTIDEEKSKLAESVKLSEAERESIEKILEESKAQLASVNAEKSDLKKVMDNLQDTLKTVEDEGNKTRDQLRLLASFPVIDERVPGDYTSKFLQDDIELEVNDADIDQQMEKQIMANNVRISILETQNEKLRMTLEKLRSFQQNLSREIPQERVPLWHQEMVHERSQNGFQPESLHMKGNHNLEQGRLNRHQLRPISASSRRSSSGNRISEKKQAKELGARMASASRNPVKIVQRDQHFEWTNQPIQREPSNPLIAWSSGRPKSGRKSATKSPTMLSCPDCDRMYPSQKDLDIHRSFCFGRM